MGNYTVTLTSEQEKALLTNMISIQTWVENAVYNKTRQMVDRVVEEALNDNTDTLLTRLEKQDIVSQLAASGNIISTVKKMPENIKLEIVKKARVKTAVERQEEIRGI